MVDEKNYAPQERALLQAAKKARREGGAYVERKDHPIQKRGDSGAVTEKRDPLRGGRETYISRHGEKDV